MFGDNHTMQIASDEVRKFMQTEITDHERMILFLNALSEHNEHMKPQQKKEYIKVYGVAAEIFEDALIPYVQKVLNVF